MFLIEYKEGHFVDGERVNWFRIAGGKVNFSMAGEDPENVFGVSSDYALTFLNNLQALNGNLTNVETFYKELNKAAA